MVLRIAFICCMLIGSISQAQHRMTYRIDKSYGDVVAAVERIVNEPRTTPFKLPNLPALISGKDIKITTVIDPSQRTYTARIELSMQTMGKLTQFLHTVEVKGYSDHYIIKTYVDIDWAWNHCIGSRIVARIISGAECQILQMERCKILEYAKQMETPHVELMEDSWAKILIDAYKLMKRASELKDEA